MWQVHCDKAFFVCGAPGTLAYMAPEQATGQADKLTARIDVFRHGHEFWCSWSRLSLS